VAVGAGGSLTLPAPGSDQEGIILALDLLDRTKSQRPALAGQSVVVVGGGNTAMDAAVTCVHAGASEVKLVCLESPREMPTYQDELKKAVEAGVSMENGWGIHAVSRRSDGKFSLDLVRCLSVFDEEGRFDPCLETAMLKSLSADVVVQAIGQKVIPRNLPAELLDPQTGRFASKAGTQQSGAHEKVFICGDCFDGPSSVVEAMASGKEAAVSADRFMLGQDMSYARDYDLVNGLDTEYQVSPERAVSGPRGELRRLPPYERSLETETVKALRPDEALREATRCLSCGRSFEMNQTCWYCLPCEIECPTQALEIRLPYQVR